MSRSYETCSLDMLDIKFNKDLPAEAVSEDDLVGAKVSWYKQGYKESIRVESRVQKVNLSYGKFAFPIYQVTELSDDEGGFYLIGWCVKDTDPFTEFYVEDEED